MTLYWNSCNKLQFLRVPLPILIDYRSENVLKEPAVVIDNRSLCSLLSQNTIQKFVNCLPFFDVQHRPLTSDLGISPISISAACGAGEGTRHCRLLKLPRRRRTGDVNFRNSKAWGANVHGWALFYRWQLKYVSLIIRIFSGKCINKLHR